MKKLLLAILVLSVASICYAVDEAGEITLTTYYPAPYGTYEQLQSNRLAIGSGANMPTNDGVINFKPRGEPASVSEGDIYYNSADHEFKYHDNNIWKPLAAGGVPSGTVVAFAGNTAPPGWLLCNGDAVSRSTYSSLLAAIGTSYGSGDGSITFNLPDLRGVFVRGLDSGRGLDPGRSLGSYQQDQFKKHKHSFNPAGTYWRYIGKGSAGVLSGGPSKGERPSIGWAGTVNETRPKNVAMNYIIKT